MTELKFTTSLIVMEHLKGQDNMQISLTQIRKKFDQLINEEVSREAIAEWAKKRQESEDMDQLEYDPPHEEKKIWRAITYLMGVDLKDMDGIYLHSVDNFVEFRKKMEI